MGYFVRDGGTMVPSQGRASFQQKTMPDHKKYANIYPCIESI